MWSLSLGSFLWEDYHSADPHYGLHLSLHFAILALIVLMTLPADLMRDFPNLTVSQLSWTAFLAVSNVSALGTAFGYYTRDTSGFESEVFLKNETLHNVGVVMITSHHLVLYSKAKSVIIVPSDTVLKIESASTAMKPAPKAE